MWWDPRHLLFEYVDDGGCYSNGPEAARFLDPAQPGHVGGLIEMMNAHLYGFWGSLTEALRTGAPQNEAKGGGDLFRQSLYRPGSARRAPARDDRAIEADCRCAGQCLFVG
jgi:hypothetical protein